jgi:hypothetical protein
MAVIFRNMDTNEYEGQGYYMPDEETFINYATHELKAEKIGENKYKHPRRNSYVCLEEARL